MRSIPNLTVCRGGRLRAHTPTANLPARTPQMGPIRETTHGGLSLEAAKTTVR